jgi:hypothetical protein
MLFGCPAISKNNYYLGIIIFLKGGIILSKKGKELPLKILH